MPTIPDKNTFKTPVKNFKKITVVLSFNTIDFFNDNLENGMV